MKTLDIAAATGSLTEFARRPLRDPVILTVEDQPVAVLLPVQGADVETVSLSLDPKFLAIIDRSRKRHEKEGGVSTAELRRRLGVPAAPGTNAKAKNRKTRTEKRTRRNGSEV